MEMSKREQMKNWADKHKLFGDTIEYKVIGGEIDGTVEIVELRRVETISTEFIVPSCVDVVIKNCFISDKLRNLKRLVFENGVSKILNSVFPQFIDVELPDSLEEISTMALMDVNVNRLDLSRIETTNESSTIWHSNIGWLRIDTKELAMIKNICILTSCNIQELEINETEVELSKEEIESAVYAIVSRITIVATNAKDNVEFNNKSLNRRSIYILSQLYNNRYHIVRYFEKGVLKAEYEAIEDPDETNSKWARSGYRRYKIKEINTK